MWFSGSGFGALLGRVLSNPMVQQALIELFRGLGAKIQQNLHNPDGLQKIAANLQQHPEAPVAAIAKGTPLEEHIAPEVLARGEELIAQAAPDTSPASATA